MAKAKAKPTPTPGPWCCEDVCSKLATDICLGYRVPGGGHPIMIASCWCDDAGSRPGDIGPREAEANARLMASSPDLLAACRLLLDSFGHPDGLTFWRTAEAAGRAAIAKAEGTTNG